MEAYTAPVGPYGDEGKVRRAWRLTKVAWTLIRGDRAMLALACCGIASATLFTALIFALGGYLSPGAGSHGGHLGLVALLALYPSVLVSVFFNVSLAAAATAAFDGEPMTFGEAIRLAWTKRRRIAAWSLVTALVGVLISEIASRLPAGNRLVGWLAGAAWGLATIFVIPILAMDSCGAIDAAKGSAHLVRKRWGEGLTGNVAIGAWTVVVAIPAGILIGVGGALARSQPGAGLALFATGLLALVAIAALAAATRQVFAVALYRYAIDAPVGIFGAGDLASPFAGGRGRTKRKSWILRIGVPILAFFVLLGLLAALFGHRHRAEEPTPTEQGSFRASYAASDAPAFHIGTPVVYRGRRIGVVTAKGGNSSEVWFSLRVDPFFSDVVSSSSGLPGGPRGHRYLCVGTTAECR